MKKLILSCIVLLTGFSAFAQEKQAEISFENMKHDFGTFIEGEKVSHDFTFVNTGTAPLILTAVNPSCGCTIPTWPKEPIMPGEHAVITAQYNSAGRGAGSFSKSITVLSNAQTGTLVLTITGNVVAKEAAPAPAPAK